MKLYKKCVLLTWHWFLYRKCCKLWHINWKRQHVDVGLRRRRAGAFILATPMTSFHLHVLDAVALNYDNSHKTFATSCRINQSASQKKEFTKLQTTTFDCRSSSSETLTSEISWSDAPLTPSFLHKCKCNISFCNQTNARFFGNVFNLTHESCWSMN